MVVGFPAVQTTGQLPAPSLVLTAASPSLQFPFFSPGPLSQQCIVGRTLVRVIQSAWSTHTRILHQFLVHLLMRAIHLALLLLFGVGIALMLGASAYLSIILGYSAPRASSTWLPFYFLPFVAISSSIPARPTHLWLIFPFVVALVVLCWPWAFVLWSVLPFQLALLCNHVSPSVTVLTTKPQKGSHAISNPISLRWLILIY